MRQLYFLPEVPAGASAPTRAYTPRTSPTPAATGRTSTWLTALLLLLGPAAMAQLSGSYTINSAQPTGGTNYASFSAAATALNTSGVSGPVTFAVSGGPYTEQLTLNNISGVSATNRVTFNGGGSIIRFAPTVSAERAVVKLNGADYVTINNLVVDATNSGTPGTYGWGIQLVNNADNNVINGCTVTTDAASTSSNFAGIVSSASATAATTAGAAASRNLTLTGNTVTGGYYGITAIGGTTASPATGLVIRNNTVREFYFYGLYSSYQAGPQIIGNDIARPTRATVSTFYGMYLTTGISGAAIEKNRIHQSFTGAGASTSTTYGIYLTTGTAATSASPNYVINNLLYDLDGNGATYVLYNGSSSSARYYHNTISVDDQTSTSSSSAYGLYQTTGQDVEFRNNIVRMTRTGTGINYGIYATSTTGGLTSNNNDLTGANNFRTAYYTGTTYTTLADWKASNNSAFDQNSTDVDPQFTSATSLVPTASVLNGTAAPLARVTDDFTGAPRSATPDMGAYEFTPAANDVAVESIDSPVSPVTAGSRTVTVTIRNNGATALNTVVLQYVLNNGTPVTQTFTLAGGLASGATRALSFTTPVVLAVGSNTLCVTGSLPNGGSDANPANNSQCTTVYTALAGTYTINKNQPTGGTNFASFTDAATALNAAGISASVRLNVLNGPYTEQFELGVIPGTSATDTIVVDGGASKQTISFSGTGTSQMATILLNGTDYVRLRNLTVGATGGTYGIGIHLVGQANNNSVINCVVQASTTSTSTYNSALAASGTLTSSTTAGDANNLYLANNVFSGGYYCVIVTGPTARATGLRVLNNEIRDFYAYGLDVEYTTAARLMGNNIHRTTRTGVTTFYGLYSLYNLGLAAESNRIHDSFTASPASTAGAYGIYTTTNDATAGNENDFVNNLIYSFNGSGTEYGVYNIGSDYNRYYHNTIVLDNAAFTGSTLSYGIYQSTLATGIDLRNNLIAVTRGGTGNRFALYFNTATSIITSNNNDLFVGTGTNYYTGYYGGNFATLANWKTANSGAYDQSSLQVDPIFTSTTSNDYHPTNVLLDGAGAAAILARVPRDLAGVARTSPPDIGAYELILVNDDVAVISIDSPSTPASPLVNPVTVTIRNGGTGPLTSVRLEYVLNTGTPVGQTFTFPALASGADLQLTFTTGVVAPNGTNTLTVTGSLPNGRPDGNSANNVQTITFVQPIPANDDPCGALSIANITAPNTISGSNEGATTTIPNGYANPGCSTSLTPKDVWYTFTTPAGFTGPVTFQVSGDAAGQVRLFTAASCSTAFTARACHASAGSGQAVGSFTETLLPATRYYLLVAGFGSSDPTGAFQITTSAVITSTRNELPGGEVTVFPNPSNTGTVTLRISGITQTSTVHATLYNALGQQVLVQQLPVRGGAVEQPLTVKGLARGIYTLRTQVGQHTITRKVVLE